MTTKERIQRAIDARATAEHCTSLAYLAIVKDILKKNTSLVSYSEWGNIMWFKDKDGNRIDLYDYKNNQLVPAKPSFKPLVDFLDEFPKAYLKDDTITL